MEERSFSVSEDGDLVVTTVVRKEEICRVRDIDYETRRSIYSQVESGLADLVTTRFFNEIYDEVVGKIDINALRTSVSIEVAKKIKDSL